MELRGKTALVLGGAGLVGQAICRQLIEEGIETLFVASLTVAQSDDCIVGLKRLFPKANTRYTALSGDIFAPADLKDIPRTKRQNDPTARTRLVDALLSPLSDELLAESTLYQWCQEFHPQIIVDCVNSATSIAYSDSFSAAHRLRRTLQENGSQQDLTAATESLCLAMEIPQLIRHVQVLWWSMLAAKSQVYLKIGTSGTGGLGITLPYTHSEGKASQLLLAKAAVAGAHSLLLFLLARTPGGPIVKELKPAAYIGWKKIGFGPILHRGQPLLLEDCQIGAVQDVIAAVQATPEKITPKYLTDASGAPRPLEAPYIDTGENGMWAHQEFALVTDAAQMEFITPEEIAQIAVWEIRGRNTGHDIVASLDNSSLGPTYRAGYMRKHALAQLRQLEEAHGVESIAFEMPGPTAAKFLYEAYLLRRCCASIEAVMATPERSISEQIAGMINAETELRARIISVGLPILLPDGQRLLRGQTIHIPSENQRALAPQPRARDLNQWAGEGWVDLRPANWVHWKERLQKLLTELAQTDPHDTSSYTSHGHRYWETDASGAHPIQVSKLVSWVFADEHGARMKE